MVKALIKILVNLISYMHFLSWCQHINISKQVCQTFLIRYQFPWKILPHWVRKKLCLEHSLSFTGHMLPATGLAPRPTFHCCSLLLNWSELKYSKSAVKFVCVVKEIDHTHEQEMLKHMIRHVINKAWSQWLRSRLAFSTVLSYPKETI